MITTLRAMTPLDLCGILGCMETVVDLDQPLAAGVNPSINRALRIAIGLGALASLLLGVLLYVQLRPAPPPTASVVQFENVGEAQVLEAIIWSESGMENGAKIGAGPVSYSRRDVRAAVLVVHTVYGDPRVSSYRAHTGERGGCRILVDGEVVAEVLTSDHVAVSCVWWSRRD